MTEQVESLGAPSGGLAGAPLPLDPDTLAALEFPDVLDVIAGYAVGELGAAALRARRPTDDVAWIVSELELVGEVLTQSRRGVSLTVTPMPPVSGALKRLRLEGSVLDLGELIAVRHTVSATRELQVELQRHSESCPRLAALPMPELDRSVARTLTQSISDDGELLDAASPALAAARREVHLARERLIRRLEAMLRDSEGSASGATVTMRNGRYVIPLRRDSRQRVDGIVHDESGSAGTLFVEPTAAIELGNALRAAVVAEERETLRVLRELTALLRPHRDAIATAHATAVQVDTVLARARWAHQVDGFVPDVDGDGQRLLLRNARHPLLLARGIAAVPFDLELGPRDRTLLITGPNTGGKTVLLKAVGLAVMLTQAGVVPSVAEGSVIPVMHRLFVDIGDHQSLAADLSTFSAHMATVQRVLADADARTLVLLDELGSGTDPAEGGALASAVLRELTRRSSLTLATTHLGALKSLATEVPGVVNGSLHFDAATLSPSYRFVKGIPGRSYGLAIARRLGVSPEVLQVAEKLVPAAERELDALLASIEARRRALDQEEQDFADRRADIERREAVANAKYESLSLREAALRQAEKQAERERKREARAYLLEARKRVEEALSRAQVAVDDATAREARRLIEDGIRQETDRDEASVGANAGGAAAIAVGTRVRLNTGASGDVSEIRSDGRLVVLVGTMRLIVSAESVTPLPSANAPQRRAVTTVDEPVREGPGEVDLRGMRADEAEALVNAAIDNAVLAEQPQVAIIHGMGTGVLREVVRRLLSRDKRVASYDFAPRQQGGLGVTIAVLR